MIELELEMSLNTQHQRAFFGPQVYDRGSIDVGTARPRPVRRRQPTAGPQHTVPPPRSRHHRILVVAPGEVFYADPHTGDPGRWVDLRDAHRHVTGFYSAEVWSD